MSVTPSFEAADDIQPTPSVSLVGTVSPSLSHILRQSTTRFDSLMDELVEIDQTPLHAHIESLQALPPSVIHAHITALEKLALALGFEEGTRTSNGHSQRR